MKHFVTMLFVLTWQTVNLSWLNEFTNDLLHLPADPVMVAHDVYLDTDMSQ